MRSLTDLTPGRFLGRYELLMPMAQGGMAAVWAARLQGTRGFQKVVAIKTILPTLSDDPSFEQMFLDEAALASRIRHPNVAQVLDLGEDAGLLYQVMEWIEGEPLSALVRSSAPGQGLPRAVAAKIMIDVCEGLHAAHELRDDNGAPVGLVHRDVSPQNILVSADGAAKVVDFGVAKASTLSTARTAAGTFKGKPSYIAPEQIKGGAVDRRADIFSLGIVLYLLTTGKHPFRADNELATLHRICSTEPAAAPSTHDPAYPPELEAVVMRAIRKEQAERFATAAEMARALQQAVPDVVSTGNTEVAALVKSLAGERLEARATALRKALSDADERAGAEPSSRDRVPGAPAPPSSLGPQLIGIEPGELTPTAHQGITPTRSGRFALAGPPSAPATQPSALVPAARRRGVALPLGIAAIVIALAGSAAVFAARRIAAGRVADTRPADRSGLAASADHSAAAPGSGPARPADSAVAVETLPAVADTAATRTQAGRAGAGGAGPKGSAQGSTSAVPHPAQGTVPSIRDPGF